MRQAGVEAAAATTIIADMRALADAEPNVFDLLSQIDDQVARASTDQLQQQLREFRKAFAAEVFEFARKPIELSIVASAEDGWQAWLHILAESVTRFRLPFAQRLFELSGPWNQARLAAVNKLRLAVGYMWQARWPEAYEGIEYLSQQEWLPQLIRARLFAILGQIELLHFGDEGAAREALAVAESLAPDDARVLCAVGELWLASKKERSKAEDYFRRAIALEPTLANGYCDLGDFLEGKKDADGKQYLPDARALYEQAIEMSPGDSLGYRWLLKFFGRQEFFDAHEAELAGLMNGGVVAAPEDEYQIRIDYGAIYNQRSDFAKARAIYQEAIALDPNRPDGYVVLAQTYEKEGNFEKAAEIYRELIKRIPENQEGYSGLAWLAQQQDNWAEALEWFQRAPRTVRQFAERFDARVGEMQARLGDYAAAEEIEKRLLRENPRNEAAKWALMTIGDDYYKEAEHREDATRIFTELFDLVATHDETFAGDYYNRLGNVHYYYSEFEEAAKEYQRAIDHQTDSPVFHRNLALAQRALKQYRQAEAELNTAFQLDDDQDLLNRQMAVLLNEEGNDYYAVSNYEKAIEFYSKAVAYDDQNVTIQANLAVAWENLDAPQTVFAALDNAIAAYDKAYAISPDKKYSAAVQRLKTRKQFLERYGVEARNWSFSVLPIAVEVTPDVVPLFQGADENSLSVELGAQLLAMRGRVENDLGVQLPGVRFRINETGLAPGTYVFLINEIPAVSGTIQTNLSFFSGPKESASELQGAEALNPQTGANGLWLTPDEAKKISDPGRDLWSPVEFMIRHLETLLRRNLGEFVGHQEVANLVESAQPDAVLDAKKLTALTIVCRSLLAEGAPINPFAEVYGTFVNRYQSGQSPQVIVEAVRSLPSIVSRLPGNGPEYSLPTIGKSFETMLSRGICEAGPTAVLALLPETCQLALTAVRDAVSTGPAARAIVVNELGLRPWLRLLLEIEFPQLPILSRQEVRSDAKLESTVIDFELSPTSLDERIICRPTPELEDSPSAAASTDLNVQPEVILYVSETLLESSSPADDQALEQMLALMRDGLFAESGMTIPPVQIEIDGALPFEEFRFKINGQESDRIKGLKANQFLVNDTAERLKVLEIAAVNQPNPGTGAEACVVDETGNLFETIRGIGLTSWGPVGYLVLALSGEIRKVASTFQTVDVTRHILESLKSIHPEMIAAVTERYSVEELTAVLRNLLDEEISTRDMRGILEALLAISGSATVDFSRYIVFAPQAQNVCPLQSASSLKRLGPNEFSEAARTFMKRYMSHKYLRGMGTLLVYLVDPQIEKRFADLESPLTPEEKTKFIEAVRSTVNGGTAAQNNSILTSSEVRRAIRELIKEQFPRLPVLSYSELSPETNIQPLARISWAQTETALTA